MKLFEYLKNILNEKKCDFLYINHTNKFFGEYVDIKKSSRFLLTNFSGSCGDALVSGNRIFLFVDSRYWEQAESETDKNLVEVVKLGTGYGYNQALKEIIPQKSKILLYQDKTSFKLYEDVEKLGFNPILTDTDYVEKYNNLPETEIKPVFQKIPVSISGKDEISKIRKLQNKIKENEVLIVSSLEDISYLLNIKSDIFEFSSTAFGKIIITKNNYNFYTCGKEFEKALTLYKGAKFLIDKPALSVKYKKYFSKYEQAKMLLNLRSVKYEAEIRHMEKCFERTDKVVCSAINEFNKKDFRENELFDFVNEEFKRFGAEKNSFHTILASGRNSSIVHFSHPTNRKIKNGEFVLLDCGGFYEGGYATDITRTFIKGKPSYEQKKIYTLVLKAFLRAYNADLSKVKTCYEIDKIARDFLEKNKPEGFTFGHGLGHSVGRCVHDGLPTISPSPLAKTKIKKNMVFTIEPGLYKPNWGGIRLENTVHVISHNGKLKLKSFSKAPFQKSLIDFSMLTKTENKYLKEWELI